MARKGGGAVQREREREDDKEDSRFDASMLTSESMSKSSVEWRSSTVTKDLETEYPFSSSSRRSSSQWELYAQRGHGRSRHGGNIVVRCYPAHVQQFQVHRPAPPLLSRPGEVDGCGSRFPLLTMRGKPQSHHWPRVTIGFRVLELADGSCQSPTVVSTDAKNTHCPGRSA
uniref:Uncharacterized protein n=1 Tax=Oryza punctata TaxID=4537 RepID=A0A1V1H0J5_ORYPU|nr:hypothetical protein [Oryza punctata]